MAEFHTANEQGVADFHTSNEKAASFYSKYVEQMESMGVSCGPRAILTLTFFYEKFDIFLVLVLVCKSMFSYI